jgi:hypothetical protein
MIKQVLAIVLLKVNRNHRRLIQPPQKLPGTGKRPFFRSGTQLDFSNLL